MSYPQPPRGTTSGVDELSQLTDVTITSPTNAQVLSYSSALSKWINSTESFSPIINQHNTFHVDLEFGSDATGDGSLSNPFQTVTFAMLQVPDIVNGWVLQSVGGVFNESGLVLRPNVHIFGSGLDMLQINMISASFALSPEFDGVVSTNQFVGVNFSGQGINFTGTGMTLSGQLLFVNTNINSLILQDLGGLQCVNAGAGGVQSLTNNLSFLIALSTVIQNINGSGGNSYLLGTSIFQTAAFDDSLGDTFLLSRSSPILPGGSMSLDGPDTTWNTDAVSYTPSISVTNGANVVFDTQAEAVNVDYSPFNYTPTDDSVEGNLIGIDNVLSGVGTYSRTISFSAQQLASNSASSGFPSPLQWSAGGNVAFLEFADLQRISLTCVAPSDLPSGVTNLTVNCNYFIDSGVGIIATIMVRYLINRQGDPFTDTFLGSRTENVNSQDGKNTVAPIAFSLPTVDINITSISWSAGIATVVLSAPPPSGSIPEAISGVTPSGYNGSYDFTQIDSVTFTYPLASDPGVAILLGVMTFSTVFFAGDIITLEISRAYADAITNIKLTSVGVVFG